MRYGNVINSRGSVIPIFNKQKNNGYFTVTHKEMTRFTITIQEARNFILNCVILSSGGEIFIPKLPSYSILQLCNIINPKNEIRIIYTLRVFPAEKWLTVYRRLLVLECLLECLRA